MPVAPYRFSYLAPLLAKREGAGWVTQWLLLLGQQ